MRPKNILLLYKMSTFQHYQQVPKDQRPDFSEVNRFKETHEEHYLSLEAVEMALAERSLTYDKVERGTIEDYHAYDLVITVGGDGTFLEGARYVKDQLILGVNSDPNWSVGQLCFATKDTVAEYLDAMLSDPFQSGTLNRMAVEFETTGRKIYFINDVLVAHANPASLSRYVLTINGFSEEQRSSGIWFSTAAGSTGAIHSAGASPLELTSEQFLYMPRELYNRWTHQPYCHLGGVLAPTSKVSLTSFMVEGMIFVDGCHQRVPFVAPEHITISQAKRPLRLVKFSSNQS